MLRVAHVLNSPGRGGVPRVVEALVRHTDAREVAPHVFYLKSGEGRDPFGELDVPRRSATSTSKATAMSELVGFLDRHCIDILHTHSFRPNLYGRMAGAVLRPAGLKIVAHYHNDYSDKWDENALCLERRLAAITDAGLAVSSAVADHVADRVGLSCELAENGIDRGRVICGDRAAGRALLGATGADLVVGLVGRVCRQKGIDTFVEAAIRSLAEVPRARFAVIGDAEDADLMAAMTARIEEAGQGDRIRFVGHCEAIADVLAALDLLATPSRWEGFGLMLAEAMAAGVPVVASEVGGIPSVVGEAGLLVPPEDPQALAMAVIGLLGDPDRRALMAQRGRERSERFDWARTAGRIREIYDKVRAGA